MLKKFLETWKSYDFSNWNESDIREDFISPLLNILGYGKGTVNNIIREKSLSLNTPYHRIGRKRVQIDYMPTIRLKSFWIIEAKPGNKKNMDMGDLLQAHLYAVHPEIQARFIVLTNGWEIRVYDALKINSWDDFIIVCNSESSLEEFGKLVNILNSKDMLRFLRTQIMQQIENSFAVELDESELNHFFSDLNRKKYKMKEHVLNNAREFRITAQKKNQENYEKELSDLSPELLIVRMDIPVDGGPRASNEYSNRIIQSDNAGKVTLLDKLAMNWRGRPHNIFKVNSLNILLTLLREGVDVETSIYQHGIIASINELALSNINYGVNSEMTNALSHLDNSCIRVGYKTALKLAMDPLTLMVEQQKKVLSIEERLTGNLSVAANMLPIINMSYENVWRIFSRGRGEDIWNGIWFLETAEEFIDNLPNKDYPKNDGDLLFFEHYGKGFDMLMVGTWNVLNRNLQIILDNEDIATDIKQFAQLTREEVILSIPKPKPAPTDWSFNLEDFKKKFN